MRARAIDALWSEWRVDREVERVLDTITEDDAFVRLIAKRADGVTQGEVRASLKRSGLRSFYPEVDAFMARLDGAPAPKDVSAPAETSPAPSEPAVPSLSATRRARRMKTTEMVERGVLPVGTRLTIRNRPDSVATVVDGKRVSYRGETMSFNAWGCLVTGWSAVQIYTMALLPDGRPLEVLRRED
jgi:hypothetical protein